MLLQNLTKNWTIFQQKKKKKKMLSFVQIPQSKQLTSYLRNV